MLNNDTLPSRILDSLLGAFIFFTVITGATYYLQSSLFVYKQYSAYTHWTVVLIGLPVIAGLILRLASIAYPLASASVGALASAALLYPAYKSFWAVPPTTTDLIIYVAVVLGMGFIASQPLRTTFMMAFRMGRFSVPTFTTPGKKPVRKSSMSKTQRIKASDNGNAIAFLELFIGFASLALSVFSVFFLGRS